LISVYHSIIRILFPILRLIGPMGELWIVLPLAAALVLWCLVSGQRRGASAIVLATTVTLALVVLMKLVGILIGPPWNPHWQWISTLFPSGHMAMGVIVYGTFVVCIGRAIPRLSVAAAGLVILMMTLLGVQRVVFNVHPILDVVGGVALGGFGLAALLRLWPTGRLHPAGVLGVAVVAMLVFHAFYGREIPSSEIIVEMAARIHRMAEAIKAYWAGI
jgi:membrane-associated phospholipid phosphatase